MKSVFGLFIALSLSFTVVAADCNEPMSNARFEGFYENVKMQENDTQRCQLIIAFSNRECVSVAQMTEFLTLITDQRLKFIAVKDTYNLLFDQSNKVLLEAYFTKYEKMFNNKDVSK